MSITQQMTLARTGKGRIILHFLTFLKDHKLAWHMAGIVRELHTA